jgi:hypothetical protein
MDLVYFLKEKLRVATYLYESAAPLFEEIHRKIGEHEPPYDSTGDPEGYDGDEFLGNLRQVHRVRSRHLTKTSYNKPLTRI